MEKICRPGQKDQMERCLKDLDDAVRSEDFGRAKQLKAFCDALEIENAKLKSNVEFKEEEWVKIMSAKEREDQMERCLKDLDDGAVRSEDFEV